MRFREPKDTEAVKWTQHVKEKMKFYGLSETRLKKILRKPDRTEKGVALKTTALMQKTKSKKKATEIWLMYRAIKRKKGSRPKPSLDETLRNQEKIRIISAWRYPGISPEGPPPIPEDIIRELKI